ncbi:hypothetical protein CN468_28140, partial [Bacillus cereus]|uniref:hypothetical protein n=1 Tax=Bacillus cereus TaxID=1396 RepID=UPI000BFAD817
YHLRAALGKLGIQCRVNDVTVKEAIAFCNGNLGGTTGISTLVPILGMSVLFIMKWRDEK